MSVSLVFSSSQNYQINTRKHIYKSPEPSGNQQCVQTSAFASDYWEATRPLSAAEAKPRDNPETAASLTDATRTITRAFWKSAVCTNISFCQWLLRSYKASVCCWSQTQTQPRDRGLAYWCHPHKAATPAVWEGTEARQAWRYTS